MRPTFETEAAGLLSKGDEFRLKLSGEEGKWSVFRFHGLHTAPLGTEYVSCYGGDADPKGRRQWHSFDPERVRAGAKLPGRMASNGRASVDS